MENQKVKKPPGTSILGLHVKYASTCSSWILSCKVIQHLKYQVAPLYVFKGVFRTLCPWLPYDNFFWWNKSPMRHIIDTP